MNDEKIFDLRKKYEKEVDIIKREIPNFKQEQKKNFCEQCLRRKNWKKEYDKACFDTFFCDGCGHITEVVNITIAYMVEEKGILPKEYMLIGGPRIFFNDKFSLWL